MIGTIFITVHASVSGVYASRLREREGLGVEVLGFRV